MLTFVRSFAALTLTVVAMALADAQPMTTASPVPAGSPAAAPSPLPTAMNPPENPLVTTRVRDEFIAWQHGRINRTTYSPAAGGTYIDALIAVVQPDIAAIGAPQTVTYRTASLLLGDLVYRYEITGPDGVISVLYSLDQQGKTDAIVFTPKIFGVTPATP